MLSLKDIVVHYGGVQALKGVSLEASEGTITCLIGANGAGKSTTLRAISGMAPLTSGEILFKGRRIDGLEPEEIVDLGIGHVPEGKKLFLDMTVEDNLLIGAYLRKSKKRIERDLKRVCDYFPVLGRAINRLAAQMSGGEQQMVAIARGLMSAPSLLLLDEPSLGLSPLLTKEVGAIIRRIADEGVTILLIEQNASLALQLATSCYVLETGNVVIQGPSAELRNNEHVKAAYLGMDASAGEAPLSVTGRGADPTQQPAWDKPDKSEGGLDIKKETPVGVCLDMSSPLSACERPWPDWDSKPDLMQPEKSSEADKPVQKPVSPAPLDRPLSQTSGRLVVKKVFRPKVN